MVGPDRQVVQDNGRLVNIEGNFAGRQRTQTVARRALTLGSDGVVVRDYI